MDTYVFTNSITDNGSSIIVTQDTTTNETKVEKLVIGTGITSYEFPQVSGTTGQVLVANTTTKILDWVNQSGGGGSGDIINGGQPGSVLIASTDNTLTLQGFSGTTLNNVVVEYKFDTINLTNGTYNITDNDFLIEITGSGTNTVVLPEADTRTGKKYIISKGYASGSLIISTQTADKIDGDDTFTLSLINTRTTLISSGTDRWLVI